MRKRARTDLRGGQPAMVVPTATTISSARRCDAPTFPKLQRLQHYQREIVSKHSCLPKLDDRGMNSLDEFDGTLLQMRTHDSGQSLCSIFFSIRIFGLDHPIGEQHKHVSGLEIDLVTLVARSLNHTQHGTSFV